LSWVTALWLVGGWDLAMIAVTLVATLVAARTVPVKAMPRWVAYAAVDGLALVFVAVAIAALVVWPDALGFAGLDTGILLVLVMVPYGLLAMVIIVGLVLLPLRSAKKSSAGAARSATTVRR